MATVVPNLEEAANVATEFIYSAVHVFPQEQLLKIILSGIDNLPNEVAHILQEIKHRETRTIGIFFLICSFKVFLGVSRATAGDRQRCSPVHSPF